MGKSKTIITLIISAFMFIGIVSQSPSDWQSWLLALGSLLIAILAGVSLWKN